MDKTVLLDWYRQLVRIRQFEEPCEKLHKQGKIGGYLHVYIGQEAIAVGTISARHPDDHVITAYRDHAHAIMVGIPMNNIMAELFGKATGCCGGRGGSMHLADVSKRFWGGHAIVGAQLSLATGLALADQYNGTKTATMCYFGEGATNIGYFHESLNLSRVWDLPVLWICENNLWGMGTRVERASGVSSISDKVRGGYNIPAKQVDGMDVTAVYEETTAALARIRAGEGPQCLEMMTYRYRAHGMVDPLAKYRQAELEDWQTNRDAIKQLTTLLQETHGVDSAQLEAITDEARQEVEEAIAFADQSPYPSADTLFDHIYAEEVR